MGSCTSNQMRRPPQTLGPYSPVLTALNGGIECHYDVTTKQASLTNHKHFELLRHVVQVTARDSIASNGIHYAVEWFELYR